MPVADRDEVRRDPGIRRTGDRELRITGYECTGRLDTDCANQRVAGTGKVGVATAWRQRIRGTDFLDPLRSGCGQDCRCTQ
ncbi:MAG: hypothetical protein FJ194_04060 [Gammaproteobacteria bacterium]|nr:hypothetical protein [Gammaproteobacteria bacterium]